MVASYSSQTLHRSRALHPAPKLCVSEVPHGGSLAALLDRDLVRLIAESYASVVPDFNRRRFSQTGTCRSCDLALTPRRNIAQALAAELPADVPAAAAHVTASQSELEQTEGYSAPFFYLPHSHLIASWFHPDQHRTEVDQQAGIDACYAITSALPLVLHSPNHRSERQPSVDHLAVWVDDANPHVRRLLAKVPRLPWADELSFQEDPSPMCRCWKN